MVMGISVILTITKLFHHLSRSVAQMQWNLEIAEFLHIGQSLVNRSYLAIDKALADVKEFGNLEIPLHLRNAPTQMMKQFGYGKNYAYAHDHLEQAKQLKYLPDSLGGKRY